MIKQINIKNSKNYLKYFFIYIFVYLYLCILKLKIYN